MVSYHGKNLNYRRSVSTDLKNNLIADMMKCSYSNFRGEKIPSVKS